MQIREKRELVVESLKLPKDSLLGASIITVTGENDIFVENYKGILQYSDDLILLQGKNRKIELKGKKLTIHSKDYNGAVEAGEAASEIGFIVSASKAPLLQ